MTKDQYYLEIAKTVATRGTCVKQLCGSVIVNNDTIISTGYNGAPRGERHCGEAGCNEENGHCQRAVHSELNSILQAAKHGSKTDGGTIYSTHFPCVHCVKAAINAGIAEIKYGKPYKNSDNFMEMVNIKVTKIE